MIATLVAGPCDGREMNIEAGTLHIPTTSTSVRDWLTDPTLAAHPPVLLIAVYRRRDGFVGEDGTARYDFAGFAHEMEGE